MPPSITEITIIITPNTVTICIGAVENEEILDLRIANISVSTAKQVLSINIRFYHPELGYKYGIDIVNPIDFSL